MLKDDDLKTIINIAKDFNVKRVWLFGSALSEDSEPNDIDLAVEGVPHSQFFTLYGKLMFALPLMVDLVDLNDDLSIASIIREKGKVIYG